MLPAMVVAFLLGIVFVCIYNPLAATARAKAERLYAEAFDREEALLKTKNAGAWLREDGADGPSVVHAMRSSNQGLELTGVTVFQYAPDQTPTERVEARKAILKDGRWELEDAWVRCRGQRACFVQALPPQHLPSHPDAGARDTLGTEFSISFWDLPNFIEIAERAGLPATQYRVRSINCYCRGLSCS